MIDMRNKTNRQTYVDPTKSSIFLQLCTSTERLNTYIYLDPEPIGEISLFYRPNVHFYPSPGMKGHVE
jgi:hypothetical protein